MVIRPIQPADEPFLSDMAWETMGPSMRALGQEAALAHPLVRRYLDGWGRPGDAGFVAADGRRLGVACYRRFPAEAPGWGFVAADIPEMSIASLSAGAGVVSWARAKPRVPASVAARPATTVRRDAARAMGGLLTRD